jgi:hypothetical protein
MENDDKYYIPEIEDLRIGYEMEANINFYISENVWVHTTLMGVDEAVRKYHGMGMYRTLYLTKEQIEVEGWTNIENEEGLLFQNKKIINIYLVYYINTKFCRIYLSDESCNFFFGYIKSINEFRYICKLLKI